VNICNYDVETPEVTTAGRKGEFEYLTNDVKDVLKEF
jgi:hypothetical protein